MRTDGLVQETIERDRGKCLECGRNAHDVHHIVPRSRGKRNSPKIWRIENMCCLCRMCHVNGQSVSMRARLLRKMHERYGYDMSWVREFGIAWEEA